MLAATITLIQHTIVSLGLMEFFVILLSELRSLAGDQWLALVLACVALGVAFKVLGKLKSFVFHLVGDVLYYSLVVLGVVLLWSSFMNNTTRGDTDPPVESVSLILQRALEQLAAGVRGV